jgi:methyl-accepting chemotaxis protein
MKALNKLWSEMTKPQEELASQEVKLSSVDELEKNADILTQDAGELEDLILDFEQHMNRAYSVYVDIKQLSEAIDRDSTELDGDIDKIESAAKELGVDVPAIDQAARAMMIADEARGKAEDIINKYNL